MMSHTRIAAFILFSILPLRALAADRPADAPPAAPPIVVTAAADATPERPRALTGLYAAAIALHGYDAYSTLTALRAGNVELNPVMQTVVGNPALFITMKAAVAAATILSAEQMWRKHQRTQAILMMIISNGVMAAVDVHNAAVL